MRYPSQNRQTTASNVSTPPPALPPLCSVCLFHRCARGKKAKPLYLTIPSSTKCSMCAPTEGLCFNWCSQLLLSSNGRGPVAEPLPVPSSSIDSPLPGTATVSSFCYASSHTQRFAPRLSMGAVVVVPRLRTPPNGVRHCRHRAHVFHVMDSHNVCATKYCTGYRRSRTKHPEPGICRHTQTNVITTLRSHDIL